MESILFIGEPLELLCAEEEGALSKVARFTASVTGTELNVAVGVARLGLRARYVSRVGKGPRSERITSFLSENGVDASGIITDPWHQTGVVMRNKALLGQRELHYYCENTAPRYFNSNDVESIDLSEVCMVFFSGVFPCLSDSADMAAQRLIEKAHQHNITVVFDPDLRGMMSMDDPSIKERLNRYAALADVFLPSLSEAQTLCGIEQPEHIAEHYLDLGTKKIVITLGKQGAYYKSAVESGIAPTFRADVVVDTAGAGDGFAVGLLSGLYDHIPLAEAVVRANAVGCMQIQTESDNGALPTMEELKEYMLSHRFVVEGCNEV